MGSSCRGIPDFPCANCGGFEDDLHVFLHCSVADHVWNLAPLGSRPSSYLPSVADLLIELPKLTVLPPVGLLIPLWPWILWNLWKFQNKLCFNKRKFSAMEIVVKAITDAKEWQAAQLAEPVIRLETVQNRGPSLVTTMFPPDTLVCNVDAAWDSKSGNCGLGCVFSGCLPMGMTGTLSMSRSHISSALLAEAIAIHTAVMHAASSNVKSLMILSDSQSLVKLIKEGGSRPALFGFFV